MERNFPKCRYDTKTSFSVVRTFLEGLVLFIILNIIIYKKDYRVERVLLCF